MTDEHRYRKALEYATSTEAEINRLKRELGEHQDAVLALAAVAEAALGELQKANNIIAALAAARSGNLQS